MSTGFYNKVAKKFGAYHTGAKYTKEFPNGEPEDVFKEKLLELSGKDKTALDPGCADGRFTLSIAPRFQKITAVDLSSGMLKSARKLQRAQKINNVDFVEADAHNLPYEDFTFNLIYNRRGPSDYPEYYRLLKHGGHFVEIDIGEKDCQEIKEIFGRGQGFGKWVGSTLENNKVELKSAGFEVLFAQGYFYNEYYASYDDLDLFLQGVPIFEDFDSEKDAKFLKDYVDKFTTEKGVKFPRHRIVMLSKKI